MKTARQRRRAGRRYRLSLAPPGLLNLTSMIDIFTVLLFFLLVYSSDLAIFTPLSILDLHLPSSQARATPPQPMKLEIVIHPTAIEILNHGRTTGRLSRRTDGSDYRALNEYLAKLKAKSPATVDITLRPEPDIAYDVLIQIMDAARTRQQVVSGSIVHSELFPNIIVGDAPVSAAPAGGA